MELEEGIAKNIKQIKGTIEEGNDNAARLISLQQFLPH